MGQSAPRRVDVLREQELMWSFAAVLIGLTLILCALDPWLAPDDDVSELLKRKREGR